MWYNIIYICDSLIKDSFNSLHEIDDECEIVSSDLILFFNEINLKNDQIQTHC